MPIHPNPEKLDFEPGLTKKIVTQKAVILGGGVKYESLRRFAWSGHWDQKTQIHQNFWVGTPYKVCNPHP